MTAAEPLSVEPLQQLESLKVKLGSVEAASRRLDVPVRTLRKALAGRNLRRGTRLLIERQLDAVA